MSEKLVVCHTMSAWNAKQYLKFAEQRTQPCRDLAARISVAEVRRIVDLGCGPGNSTKVLAERWPTAEITGLDNSAEMIEVARREQPGHRWLRDDITAWALGDAGQFDVVFSNAALQWVPDHASIYPKLLERTTPGGVLAVQVPGNFNSPPHQLMREIASSSSWRNSFSQGSVKEWHVHDKAFYYDLMVRHAERLDIWEVEYLHVLPDAEAIVEWYRATGLRPFLDALSAEEDRNRFTAEYLRGIRALYPPRPDGNVLFPFRRLFLIASPHS